MTEQVVLLDPDGSASGVADKASVHHAATPLHLAFSCYVVDADDRVLLTRRALTKLTWPGVRTNSCCGHPAPGERLVEAVRRRVREELGLSVGTVDLVLPGFAYRAVMADGTVEHELCPVLRAVAHGGDPLPDPGEVEAAWWAPWPEVVDDAEAGRLSPWAQRQVSLLAPLGAPSRWPVADPAGLPAAARL